ncbi:hypothetical protein ACHAQA_001390 [Verticillium albo-atrum]
MAPSDEQPQADVPRSPTREQYLADMQKHVEKIQQENPEWDGYKEQWWVSGIHFTEDVKEYLTPEKREKYDACFKRMYDAKYERKVVNEALDEARTYVVDDEALLKRFDEEFRDREALASIHEHLVAKETQSSEDK